MAPTSANAADADASAPRLEGAPNFRDLGGLRSVDGRTLRPRVLYRSEGPAHFNARDIATLQALNIRTVCDLRSDGERRADPNEWCSEQARLHIDIPIDVRVAGNRAWDLMRCDPTAAGGRAAMAYNYRGLGRSMEAPFRQLIEHVLRGSQVPLLIHCTGGKDRTGVMVALLLHALGISETQIEEDYLLTNAFANDGRFAAGLRKMFDDLGIVDPPAELLELIVGVEASYLHVAMQEILRGTGSLERFFAERVGIDPSRREALKDIFLEPARHAAVAASAFD
jgi:protein-tyrosine phosphatase